MRDRFWLVVGLVLFVLVAWWVMQNTPSTINRSTTGEKEIVLPDPDRLYWDGNGNAYNYKGELIKTVSQNDDTVLLPGFVGK